MPTPNPLPSRVAGPQPDPSPLLAGCQETAPIPSPSFRLAESRLRGWVRLSLNELTDKLTPLPDGLADGVEAEPLLHQLLLDVGGHVRGCEDVMFLALGAGPLAGLAVG